MIFLGDIAIPSSSLVEKFDEQLRANQAVFKNQPLIANLEGLISAPDNVSAQSPVLFNHPKTVEVLKNWETRYLGLANNHTLDLSQDFSETEKLLQEKEITCSGAGESFEKAHQPAFFHVDDKPFYVFNHCWHVNLQHQNNPDRGLFVATINEKKIIKHVKQLRNKSPDSAIIVFLHWNFDLETLPFPMHRQLGKALIDNGANVVVGCHSHCVQGGEKYGDGYIVYGLGNFYVPWYSFINGTIEFPEFSKTELAFEWSHTDNSARVHFFKYEYDEGNHTLNHLESAPFEDSPLMDYYSPYAGMSDQEYLSYFKKHRRKKGLVPVYKDYRHTFQNQMKDALIINRIRFARLLARMNLREWNN